MLLRSQEPPALFCNLFSHCGGSTSLLFSPFDVPNLKSLIAVDRPDGYLDEGHSIKLCCQSKCGTEFGLGVNRNVDKMKFILSTQILSTDET